MGIRGPERGEQPRSRILGAAAEVFAQHGFAGAGVDEIARRAGVNKAMLYYHVGDKATLYAEVVLGYLELVKPRLRTAVASTGDPAEKLRRFLGVFARVIHEFPTMPRIMLREIAGGAANLPDSVLASFGEVMGMTRTVLDEGRAAGVFRDVAPVLTHLLVVGGSLFISVGLALSERMASLGMVPADSPTDPGGLAPFLADVLLHGLATDKAGGGLQ